MGVLRAARKLYIKTTDYTHSYQGKTKQLVNFYWWWSYCYDLSVGLDPAFRRQMHKMISMTVEPGDTTLDIGCGTGISTLYASGIGKRIIGIDLSAAMLHKLEKKISRRKAYNIEVLHGRFPEALPQSLKFESVISSFAIVHSPPEQRKGIYKQIFDILLEGGRLGLFSAQGEMASSFETKTETADDLAWAGFTKVEIDDVSDIYRIVTAKKQ